ncbi:uncharacterized protein LOC127712179 [Mytilus californianus]|uniref:uncharacterized protein LOC127712179 n=1 Tax=Mytilus californianus TaxID=6549 RepID=UPI002246283F|nr:uncharacterized protein LOC127712179 [Mytilus californianus]
MRLRLQQISTFIVFILLLDYIMTVESASIKKCTRPSRRTMRRIRAEFFRKLKRRLHDSFGSLTHLTQQTVRRSTNEGQKYVHKRHISDDPKEGRCPRNKYVEESCPHYFVLDVDDNRIPEVILQAKCKCSKCLELNSYGSFQNSSYAGCETVDYYSRVLRVTNCVNGYFKYDEVWEPVAVACRCTNQRQVRVNA